MVYCTFYNFFFHSEEIIRFLHLHLRGEGEWDPSERKYKQKAGRVMTMQLLT